MIELITERPRVQNARLLRSVLLALGDERTRAELQAIMCDRAPFWRVPTFSTALAEAIRRKWISRIEDDYGIYYAANRKRGLE